MEAELEAMAIVSCDRHGPMVRWFVHWFAIDIPGLDGYPWIGLLTKPFALDNIRNNLHLLTFCLP